MQTTALELGLALGVGGSLVAGLPGAAVGSIVGLALGMLIDRRRGRGGYEALVSDGRTESTLEVRHPVA